MTFQEAIQVLIDNDESRIDDARSVVTRAVCDELGISWNSEEAGRLGDWIANGAYDEDTTPDVLAVEWRR